MKKFIAFFVLIAMLGSTSIASAKVKFDYSDNSFAHRNLVFPTPFEENITETFKWAQEYGITTAKTLAEFRADDKITREEVAAILFRLYKKSLLTVGPETLKRANKNRFSDADTITPEFREAVTVMRKNGILKGSNGKFHPKSNITFHELVMIALNAQSINRGKLKDTDISKKFYTSVGYRVPLSVPADRATFFRIARSFSMCMINIEGEVTIGCQ